MSKQILRALPELIKENVISNETADNIRKYYDDNSAQPGNRLFIVFGILGSLLVGMGIVLILAHNWDSLPNAVKLAIGLIPLLIGQVLCAYVLFKRSESKAWREGAAVFLFFAVAISIAVISQVYHRGGSLSEFLVVWMGLSLPICYLMRSSTVSLLLIAVVTWYGSDKSYFRYSSDHAPLYWALLALIVPFYYLEFLRKKIKNNFFYFHSWSIVISLTICLGILTEHAEELMFVAYMCMFSTFIIISQLSLIETDRVLTNAYLVVGSLGVIGLLLAASFDFYWDELWMLQGSDLYRAPEFLLSVVLTIIASLLLLFAVREKGIPQINPKGAAYILFILLALTGIYAPGIAQLLTNIIILLFAVVTIRSGAIQNHLGVLNYGLMILTALVICRFFDTDLSFVIRGILFIGVGAGFFLANYYTLKKRRHT